RRCLGLLPLLLAEAGEVGVGEPTARQVVQAGRAVRRFRRTGGGGARRGIAGLRRQASKGSGCLLDCRGGPGLHLERGVREGRYEDDPLIIAFLIVLVPPFVLGGLIVTVHGPRVTSVQTAEAMAGRAAPENTGRCTAATGPHGGRWPP